MGAGNRQRSGDLQCVGVFVVKSLGNTRNQFILWEVVEYLAQDDEHMKCLHVHKGSCRQNFVPWTVHVWEWLKRIRDRGMRPVGGGCQSWALMFMCWGCAHAQGYLKGYACV